MNGGWVTTYLGNGDGTFNSPNWFETCDHLFSVETGNFDGDADLEVALGTFQQLFTADYACASQVHLYSISPVISTDRRRSSAPSFPASRPAGRSRGER